MSWEGLGYNSVMENLSSICEALISMSHSFFKKKNEQRNQRINIKQFNRKIHSLRYCNGCSNFFRLWAPLFTYAEQNSARAQLEFSGSKGLKSLSSCKPAPGLQQKSARNLRCSICGRLLSHRKKKRTRWNTHSAPGGSWSGDNGRSKESLRAHQTGPPFPMDALGVRSPADPLLCPWRTRERLICGQHLQGPGIGAPRAGGAQGPHRLQR